MNFYERYLFLYHYIKTKYRKGFVDRDHLTRWQNKKVEAFLKKTLVQSPFYKERFSSLDIESWRELPIIDKSIMMEHFDLLNTKGITKDKAFAIAFQAENTRDFSSKLHRITVGLSSGTSGNRGLFLVSDEERMVWAGTILAKVLPGSLFDSRSHRIAFFLRANSNLYTSLHGGKVSFSFYDMMRSIDEHVRELNKFGPTLLVAPPSILRILAQMVLEGKLHVMPEKIVSVAEVLDPIDRKFVEEVFGNMVHQVYQCTEGFLGCTCQYGTLHLNEELLVIQKEYLDKEQRKFSPIITDFCRKTQPIIRYRLNDILTEKKEPCQCGSVFTALEFIEGRCDDIFYLPSCDDGRLIPVFPDFLRRAVMSSSDYITEYQIIQKKIDLMSVCIISSCSNEEKSNMICTLKKELNKLFEGSNCKIPMIEYHQKIRHEAGNKLKRVVRDFYV